ncbi:MAG: tryptophan-rich sensory protein [Clostridiales bacterium]|nr:tryptophan-rich sensory protein [Clostridiales bacterium]
MKIQWKKLILCIAIPLAVGGLSALLTRGSMEIFQSLNKPTLSPPGWLFPIVWTILYILMGIASYLVLTSEKTNRSALTVYGIQLVFNFFWSIIFFNLEAYLFSFIWLIILWILIFITMIMFFGISEPAGYLLLPYLLWVTFAGYLNFYIYLLN